MDDADKKVRFDALQAAFEDLPLPHMPEYRLNIKFILDSLSSLENDGEGLAPEQFREKRAGRPNNFRAKAVAVMTAHGYNQVTGEQPTLTIPSGDDRTPKGSFFELIVEIFRILELPQSPEHFAKVAIAVFPKPEEAETKGD